MLTWSAWVYWYDFMKMHLLRKFCKYRLHALLSHLQLLMLFKLNLPSWIQFTAGIIISVIELSNNLTARVCWITSKWEHLYYLCFNRSLCFQPIDILMALFQSKELFLYQSIFYIRQLLNFPSILKYVCACQDIWWSQTHPHAWSILNTCIRQVA